MQAVKYYKGIFACFAESLTTVLPSSDLEQLQNDWNNMEPYEKLKSFPPLITPIRIFLFNASLPSRLLYLLRTHYSFLPKNYVSNK